MCERSESSGSEPKRYPALAARDGDRETLVGNGVAITGIELDPVEGTHGVHVATWIDDEIELEFMIRQDAPVGTVVDTLFASIVRAAMIVGNDSVVVAA